MKKYLQQLIIDGKTELCLKELNNYFQTQKYDENLLELVILTKSRFQNLQKEEHSGILNRNDIEKRHQEIKRTCLHLINKIPDVTHLQRSDNEFNDELIVILSEITSAYNSALTVRRETIQLGLKFDKDEKGIEKRNEKNQKIRLVKKDEYTKQMKNLNSAILELDSVLLKIGVNKFGISNKGFMDEIVEAIKVIVDYLTKIHYESQQKMRQFDDVSNTIMLSKLVMLEDFIWGQENKITGFSKHFKYQYNNIVSLFKEIIGI